MTSTSTVKLQLDCDYFGNYIGRTKFNGDLEEFR